MSSLVVIICQTISKFKGFNLKQRLVDISRLSCYTAAGKKVGCILIKDGALSNLPLKPL